VLATDVGKGQKPSGIAILIARMLDLICIVWSEVAAYLAISVFQELCSSLSREGKPF
jgi:hypothetical protein